MQANELLALLFGAATMSERRAIASALARARELAPYKSDERAQLEAFGESWEATSSYCEYTRAD